MKIVAGKYGGRALKTPSGLHIRPTSDKVRGAVFNMLNARGAVAGANVIDGFCGTGALGLEALSQGADFCTFIDNDKISLQLARDNVAALKAMDDSDFILRDVRNLGPRPDAFSRAGLVFLDPPYNNALTDIALENLLAGRWLAADCICVLETEKNFAGAPAAFEMLLEKNYGDTKITLLRLSAP